MKVYRLTNADKTTRCTKCISKSFSLKTNGTCVSCSEAPFANCATCGPTPSGGKAKSDMCSEGFTLQDDKLACVSCSIIGCGLCAHGKCFECRGNGTDCGNELSNVKEETANVKLIDCGVGDCWAYTTETLGSITFSRGCSNETCSPLYENENCKAVPGKKECKQCCRGEKCNTWPLGAGGTGLIATCFIIKLSNILYMLMN
ncbi:DgyrCDS838 [Dimorphilus gyrociliatus]|uniref:DgyrCDS838 n=1 Tax=Dimorphilus gyrociliatus TaxID=2664684 RepID=A0A7I8V8K9_9ANNE|nr:DgyrCDS838 [Dimorphilus gyrociliatus]